MIEGLFTILFSLALGGVGVYLYILRERSISGGCIFRKHEPDFWNERIVTESIDYYEHYCRNCKHWYRWLQSDTQQSINYRHDRSGYEEPE